MIIILGAGGHAKVCAEALRSQRRGIVFEFRTTDFPIDERDEFVIGIGNLPVRRQIFDEYMRAGRTILSAIHLKTIIANDVELGDALQLMAGAIIQPGCKIGDNVIINTGASVDHDCTVGDHVHIAPGAVLCGEVTVGDMAFVGAGAIVPEGRKIPAYAFVPAGTIFK